MAVVLVEVCTSNPRLIIIISAKKLTGLLYRQFSCGGTYDSLSTFYTKTTDVFFSTPQEIGLIFAMKYIFLCF